MLAKSNTIIILGSILICGIVGPLAGLVLWAIIAGQQTLIYSASWFLFAICLAGPFGVVGGVLIGLTFVVFPGHRPRKWGLRQFILIGLILGSIMGVSNPLIFIATGWGPESDKLSWIAAYGSCGAFAGAICGLLVGFLSWKVHERQG